MRRPVILFGLVGGAAGILMCAGFLVFYFYAGVYPDFVEVVWPFWGYTVGLAAYDSWSFRVLLHVAAYGLMNGVLWGLVGAVLGAVLGAVKSLLGALSGCSSRRGVNFVTVQGVVLNLFRVGRHLLRPAKVVAEVANLGDDLTHCGSCFVLNVELFLERLDYLVRYREIEPFIDEPYADFWFEKSLAVVRAR